MTESSTVAPPTRLHHLDALPVGARLGEFEIQALLGVGGFGMVYQAFDHSLRRSVAIKEYMPCALAGRSDGQSLWVRTSGDTPTFQAGLASFVKEAQLLAQFDHPSLVKVFRIWEANNTAYMVMPLYVGMTLKQARAHMRQPPSEAWLRKLLWSVLDALRVLHDAKTLHRDISPDNIFLQDNGPPVLLDLGAARHAIGDAEHQHTAVLKVNYAPIEQYAAESAADEDHADDGQDLRQGPWSDLYSLGAVVYGCICNDTPLPATLRAIRDRMVRFRRVAKTVKRQFGVEYSPAFVHAISETLHLQPSARPQSIDEFLALMEMQVAPDAGHLFHWREALEVPDTAEDEWAHLALAEDDVAPTRFMEPVGEHAGVDLDIGAAFDAAGDEASAALQDGALNPQSAPPALSAAVVRPAATALAQSAERGPGHAAPTGHAAHAKRKPSSEHPHREAPAARSRRSRRWLGALAALVLVGSMGWWGLRAPEQPQSGDDDIITEWASPPAATVQPVALDASQPVAMVVAQELPVQPPEAVQVTAPVSETAPPRPAPQRKASQAVRAVAAPSVPVAVQEKPEPEPEHAPVRPAPVRARSVASVQGPIEACAGAGFLARPMCIHQECQKPALLGHPVCVENRKRQEAEAQSRDFNGR
jgi:serine/threonine protein kinase